MIEKIGGQLGELVRALHEDEQKGAIHMAEAGKCHCVTVVLAFEAIIGYRKMLKNTLAALALLQVGELDILQLLQ